MNHVPRRTSLVICAVVAGCASLGGCASRALPGQDSGRYLVNTARGDDENAKLYTDLIEQLIRQDKLYAAHAHLEQRQAEFGQTDQLAALEAEILRRMGQTERAEAMYRRLIKSDYAAEAYHGLGLIEAERDPAQSLADLRKAVNHAPTNTAMRNDLGYAELLAGHVGRAQTEITTAYQLDEKSRLAANNYVLVLLTQGDEAAARRIARRSDMDEARFARLRTRARALTGAASSSAPEPAATEPESTPEAPAASGDTYIAQLTTPRQSAADDASAPPAPIAIDSKPAAEPETTVSVPDRPNVATSTHAAPTHSDGTSNAIPFSSREIK